MKRLLVVFIGLLILLTACSNKLPIETNMSKKVNDFNFTTQDGDQLSLEDLKGEWWIADFIFTNCTTVCLPMSFNMSNLQNTLQEEDINIQFISFTVDPEYDTPEVLRKYGIANEADFDNWTFLTGYDFQTIKELSVKSFQAPLKEPKIGDDQVLHDVRFFLVDPEGNVIKGYHGVKTESMDDILIDLEKLQNDGLL